MADKMIPTIHIIGQGVIGSLLATSALLQQLPVQQYIRTKPAKQLNHTQQLLHSDKLSVQWLSEQTVELPEPYLLDTLSPRNEQLSGLVIIPVKAYQVANVLAQLQGKLAPDATLILLHNGMGSIEFALRLFPNHTIVAGTTTLAGFKHHSIIKHTAWGQTQLGVVSGHKQDPENNLSNLAPPSNLAPTLEHISLINLVIPEVTWHDEILTPLFTKLAVNCVINPLTALHDVRNGKLSSPRLFGLITKIVTEVVAVARTQEVLLDNVALFEKVITVIHDTKDNYSSMHQDIKHGRKSEIEQINGYVVALGIANGVDVSQNKSLLQQILAIEKAA